MRAYCYASGLIEFGRTMPDGALPVARGPEKTLREFVSGVARHGYTTKPDANGRVTKVPGSDTLLVPGVPEAPNQIAAVDALTSFRAWIAKSAPKGVVI